MAQCYPPTWLLSKAAPRNSEPSPSMHVDVHIKCACACECIHVHMFVCVCVCVYMACACAVHAHAYAWHVHVLYMCIMHVLCVNIYICDIDLLQHTSSPCYLDTAFIHALKGKVSQFHD